MTLTLEDVKNVRFPIAKRLGEGYRAIEVDDFVDAVDATFTQLADENERLKAQLSAMDADDKAPQASATSADQALAAENDRLKAELAELRNRPAAQGVAAADAGELERLRDENQTLKGELDQLRTELANARQGARLSVVDEAQGRVEKIVVTTSAEASPALVRMVQLHTDQAEAVVAEAKAEAERTVAEAEQRASELTQQAQHQAEQVQSEARSAADRLTQEAQANAERVNSDADQRRRELFESLEVERDQLVGKIDQLRGYESNYRRNLVQHLTESISRIESVEVAPAEQPALLLEPATKPAPEGGQAFGVTEPSQTVSATPRVDALLAEGQQH